MKRTIPATMLAALLLFASPASAQVWEEIPNTSMLPVMPTIEELGADWCYEIGCPDGQMAWVGMAMQDGKIWLPRPGGHADWGGAESYTFDLATLTWTRSEPVQRLTGPLDLMGRCPLPDQGGPSQHTYGGVAALGNGLLFVMGHPGYCKGAYMKPEATAYLVDTTTVPWTWTAQPHLAGYGGPAATAVSGGNLFIMEDKGKFAVVDIATMAITKSGAIGAVKKNGVSLPGTSSFASQMAAGAISTAGQFCTGSPTAVTCSNVNGVKIDTSNDDSFGRVIRRPTGTSAPVGSIQAGLTVGKFALAAMPDGWLAIWDGTPTIRRFRPDDQPYHAESDGHECTSVELPACATDGDEWEEIPATVGPVSGLPYSKMFWWPEQQKLVVAPGQGSNVWTMSFAPPPEEPQQQGNFEERRNAPGVMFSTGFDTAVPKSSKMPEGVFINGSSSANVTAVLPRIIDNAGNNVMKFEILNHSTAGDAGQYYVELPEQIGPGEAVFIQWRQFMPASLVNTTFIQKDGVRLTAPKMLILDRTGTASCSESPNLHYVVVKANWGGVSAYVRCPSSETIETPGPYFFGSRVFDSQPISDDWRLSHQCWTDHREGCVPVTPDVWITHQTGIDCPAEPILYKTKIRYFCRVQHWQTVDGRPTETVIDKIVPIGGVEAKWGRAWFLPYMTFKGAQQDHADTFTLLDEVIISRQRVPDPV